MNNPVAVGLKPARYADNFQGGVAFFLRGWRLLRDKVKPPRKDYGVCNDCGEPLTKAEWVKVRECDRCERNRKALMLGLLRVDRPERVAIGRAVGRGDGTAFALIEAAKAKQDENLALHGKLANQ